MSGQPSQDRREGPFRLLEWEVHPSLNRLVRGETSVRVEPKQMDVLFLLVEKAGTVVSKDEIVATVWDGAFVTESVITRAVASLRKALGDDARAPRYLETIAKRGYRLLVDPDPLEEDTPEAPSRRSAPQPSRRPAGEEPAYSAGQWVRGERFFGREGEIAEILDGHRNGLWVVGTRAVGKTSLLKHLELLTAGGERYFPLFWDLQGNDDPEALGEDFQEVLTEAEDRLGRVGISLGQVAGDAFLPALGRLRRALRSRGLTLLLLWDEAEELIHLHRRDPTLLRKLRRALQSKEGIRTVMASSPLLWKLGDQRDETSPFLHGFAPPLYLGPLARPSAQRLVAPVEESAGSETAQAILQAAGGHPYLLHLLCSRFLESGSLDPALDSVAADPAVSFFFSVDVDLLTDAERQLLGGLALGERADLGSGEARTALLHLEQLGLVGRDGEGSPQVANPVLRRWLRERPDQKVPDQKV